MKLARYNVLNGRHGFTMVEFMVASAITVLVAGSMVVLSISGTRSWREVALRTEADHNANIAVSRMVYGTATHRGLRCASQATKTTTGNNWSLTYQIRGQSQIMTNKINFSASDKRLTFEPDGELIGRDIEYAFVEATSKEIAITVRAVAKKGKLSAVAEDSTRVSFRNLGS